MKKLLALIATLSILAAIDSHAGPAVSGRTEPFTVGLVLPLTGTLADYGVATKNGLLLAIEEQPALFKGIKFQFEDSGYDSKAAIVAFHKLRTVDRVSLILVWGFGPAQAVAPIAEAEKYPTIVVTAERGLTVGKQHLIRFCYFAEQVGEALASALRATGKNKFGLVKIEQAFINATTKGFQGALRDGESAEILNSYEMSEQNFTPSILKAKEKQLDAVGVMLSPGQISQFFRQKKTLQAEFSTFGSHYFESYTEIRDAKGGMDGALFASPYVTPEFHARYFARYGDDNRIAFAGSGYDFATLTAELFATGPLPPAAVLGRYRTSMPQRGATGPFYYEDTPTEGPSFRFKVTAKKIENGKIVRLE